MNSTSSLTRAPTKGTSFGVGCFHFGVPKTERGLKAVDYLTRLRRALESIDAVSHVEIEAEGADSTEDFSSDEDQVDEEEQEENVDEQEQEDAGWSLPLPHLRYHFDIYVPTRIQADLLSFPGKFIDTGTEHFRVYVRYAFHGPVSFIEPVNPIPGSNPSSGVAVVRKYLERNLAPSPDSLRFQMVGPSPFHADFFLTLEQGGRSKDLFITNHKPQPGYDTLEIACCTSLGVEDARDALFESVLDEFALFYDLKRRMSAQMDSWFRTQESIREALKPTSARRGWQKLGWLFTRRTIFRRIIHSLLTFRAEATYFKAQIREDYRSHYESGKYQPFIKSFVDGEIADIYEYPVSEALETMKFEFDRVTKYLEWSTVFLAAIFGGIVGAAVTRMVTPPDVPTVSAAPPIAVSVPKPTCTAHAVSPLHPK